jgi:hypothetical protein
MSTSENHVLKQEVLNLGNLVLWTSPHYTDDTNHWNHRTQELVSPELQLFSLRYGKKQNTDEMCTQLSYKRASHCTPLT